MSKIKFTNKSPDKDITLPWDHYTVPPGEMVFVTVEQQQHLLCDPAVDFSCFECVSWITLGDVENLNINIKQKFLKEMYDEDCKGKLVCFEEWDDGSVSATGQTLELPEWCTLDRYAW